MFSRQSSWSKLTGGEGGRLSQFLKGVRTCASGNGQVCRQHEKPLVLQLCRLVRGFTHPASYFAAKRDDRSKDGGRREETGKAEGLALFSVEEFSAEMVGVYKFMSLPLVPRRSSSIHRKPANG